MVLGIADQPGERGHDVPRRQSRPEVVLKRQSDQANDSRLFDASAVVVVFITKLYIKKAGGDGPNGEADNCFLEFGYASTRKTAAKMICVVMEPCCLDTSTWTGAVGMQLGQRIYIDCTSDEQAKFAEACEQIRREIIKVAIFDQRTGV